MEKEDSDILAMTAARSFFKDEIKKDKFLATGLLVATVALAATNVSLALTDSVKFGAFIGMIGLANMLTGMTSAIKFGQAKKTQNLVDKELPLSKLGDLLKEKKMNIKQFIEKNIKHLNDNYIKCLEEDVRLINKNAHKNKMR